MPVSSKLDAVLFDLDGTLIDTAPDFAIVLNQLCQRHGQPLQSYQAIRNTVSHGARALVTLAFDRQPEQPGFEQLRQGLLQLYSQQLAVKSCLFPGVNELLHWLEQQSLPWGIVTNKPRQYAMPLLLSLNLLERCGTLVCPDDVSNSKPHPEPMLLACQQLSCQPENTIYIGDHRRDIEAGKNAAMKTIAANYGYIEAEDPSENWQAHFYVDHASDIQPLLSAHFSL